MLTAAVVSLGNPEPFVEGQDFSCFSGNCASSCCPLNETVTRTFMALQHRLNAALAAIGSKTARLVADGKLGARTLAVFVEIGKARTGRAPTGITTVRQLAARAFDVVLELEGGAPPRPVAQVPPPLPSSAGALVRAGQEIPAPITTIPPGMLVPTPPPVEKPKRTGLYIALGVGGVLVVGLGAVLLVRRRRR